MNDETQVFEALPSEEDNSQEFQATVVTNEPVEAESPPEEVEASEAEEETSKGKDPWYKRRIDELTRDKHEARRLAERYEKMLERFTAQQNTPEPLVPNIQPPDPNDFAGGQYDPRYIQAQLEYTRVSAIEEAKRAVAQEYEQRQAQQAFIAAQAKLETSEAAARAKYVDYDAVIDPITSDPRLAQNQTIRQAVLGMENGPEIAYALGRNLDVAYEIASMNPIQAGMRLAELMNRAPRKVTNAPTPINPLNGAATSNPRGSKNYAEMSTAEYIAARNAEELAARQAMYKR